MIITWSFLTEYNLAWGQFLPEKLNKYVMKMYNFNAGITYPFLMVLSWFSRDFYIPLSDNPVSHKPDSWLAMNWNLHGSNVYIYSQSQALYKWSVLECPFPPLPTRSFLP